MTSRILDHDAAPALWVLRDRLRFFGRVPGADLNLIEVEVPPGSGTPPHSHASPETFRVLSGEMTFTLFDGAAPREIRARPGTVVTIESRVPHNYANAGDGPAAMLVLLDDSMIDFFQDLGHADAPPPGPPSDAEIGEVMSACARHGIEIMGGPPTRA